MAAVWEQRGGRVVGGEDPDHGQELAILLRAPRLLSRGDVIIFALQVDPPGCRVGHGFRSQPKEH